MPDPGTLYVEARKLTGFDNGFGFNSVEVNVRNHLYRVYK
jgi:hypothetical protein